jgi:hypothetical protein
LVPRAPKAPSDEDITSLARDKVLRGEPRLDDESASMVRTNVPSIRWRTIDWFLEYSVLWTISSNRELLVEGTWSDEYKLKYARVKIRPKIEGGKRFE